MSLAEFNSLLTWQEYIFVSVWTVLIWSFKALAELYERPQGLSWSESSIIKFESVTPSRILLPTFLDWLSESTWCRLSVSGCSALIFAVQINPLLPRWTFSCCVQSYSIVKIEVNFDIQWYQFYFMFRTISFFWKIDNTFK